MWSIVRVLAAAAALLSVDVTTAKNCSATIYPETKCSDRAFAQANFPVRQSKSVLTEGWDVIGARERNLSSWNLQ